MAGAHLVTNRSNEAILALDRKTVAVIVPDMENPFNVEVIGNLERCLRTQGVVSELTCTGRKSRPGSRKSLNG